MPYTPNPLDYTAPLNTEQGLTAAAEFRALKAYIGRLPVSKQSAAYTITADDAGKEVRHPTSDATARVFSIQAHATKNYRDGDCITVSNRHGAGVITIAPANTMYLAGSGITGNRALAPDGICTMSWDIDTLSWLISGVGLT